MTGEGMKADQKNIESLKHIKNASIPLMESFYTIQGEGAHTGTAAYFIRTAGCDVGCVWCDVKESWNQEDHPYVAIGDVLKDLKKYKTDVVIVTGGEPFMHDLDLLTTALKQEGKKNHIETSGTHPISGEWDWICFSPKKFKRPLDQFYSYSQELKVVIYHPSDLNWAQEHADRMNKSAELYLQPEWSKKEEMMPLIVEYVKDNPDWKISLQTHKYLDIP